MPISDIEFERVKRTLEKGGQPHSKLAERLGRMRDESQYSISQFYSEWDDQEARQKYYLSSDRVHDTSVSGNDEQVRKIIIPFSFMSQQVKLSMLMRIFYHDDPHVALMGHSEEDFTPARLMESLLDAQAAKMDRWLKDHQWFKDAKTYGAGIMYAHWDERFGQVAKRIKAEDGSTISTILLDDELVYQGNNCVNIDPFSFLPDPYRSLRNQQKGTFCGHRWTESIEELRDLGTRGVLFNTEHVTAVVGPEQSSPQERSDRYRTSYGISSRPGRAGDNFANENLRTQRAMGGRAYTEETPYAGITHIFWRCRPKEWGIGESDMLSIWHFILSDDGCILLAEPHEYPEFPYFILEPFGDLYTRAMPSESGFLAEIEDFATFLITTRKDSVYKNLGDGILYDAQLIDEADINARGQFGKRIAVRRRIGTSIDDVFRQLEFQDTTTGHVQDTQFLFTMFEYITGVSSTMLGAVSSSSRNTATEVRGATNLATQRTTLEASLYSAQGYAPLNRYFIMQNMNRLTLPQFLAITGMEGEAALMKGEVEGKILRVPPQKLLGNFDLAPFDGSFPVDTLSQADALERLFGILAQSPLVPLINWEYMIDKFSNLIGAGRAGQYLLPPKEAAQQVQMMQMMQQLAGLGLNPAEQGTVVPDETAQAALANGSITPVGGPGDYRT